MLLISQPTMQFVNPGNNNPVARGKLYFGFPNLDPKVLANRVDVYYVNQLGNTVVLPQPVDLSNSGVPVYLGRPIEVLANEAVSIRVDDRNGNEVYLIESYSGNDTGQPAMRSVASVAELQTTRARFDGESAFLTSYYSGQNKGGGNIIWDASSTVDDLSLTNYFKVDGVDVGRWVFSSQTQKVDPSVQSDFKAKVQGLLASSTARVVIFGDSTEAGVGVSGAAVYGESNSYLNDGWGSAFAYSLIAADSRFNPPPFRARTFTAGLAASTLTCPFPQIRLTKLDDKFERFEIQNNSTVQSTTFTVYHNERTADTAARFRVIVNRADNGVEVANFLIDTYVPQVSYATTVNRQTAIAKTTVTLSQSTRRYTVTLTDVETLDRGSGVAADGTALYLGCTFGQGVSYHNIAVSSSTLRNDSPDNILRGITTEERLALGLTFNPNIIFIGWGTNDSKVGVSNPEQFRLEYIDFINQIRTARSDCVICLITDPTGASGSIYENNVVYNRVIRQVAELTDCMLLDVESLFKQMPSTAYADDVHPSVFGYSMITNAACSAVGLQPYGFTETRPVGQRVIVQELSVNLTATTNNTGSYVDIYRTTLTVPQFGKVLRVSCKIIAGSTAADIVNDSYRAKITNNITAATVVLDETIVNVGSPSAGTTDGATVVTLIGRYEPSIDALKSLTTFDLSIEGKDFQMRTTGVQHKLLIEWLG